MMSMGEVTRAHNKLETELHHLGAGGIRMVEDLQMVLQLSSTDCFWWGQNNARSVAKCAQFMCENRKCGNTNNCNRQKLGCAGEHPRHVTFAQRCFDVAIRGFYVICCHVFCGQFCCQFCGHSIWMKSSRLWASFIVDIFCSICH